MTLWRGISVGRGEWNMWLVEGNISRQGGVGYVACGGGDISGGRGEWGMWLVEGISVGRGEWGMWLVEGGISVGRGEWGIWLVVAGIIEQREVGHVACGGGYQWS
jgi:hypothetical protein